MEDEKIILLYKERSEDAISETDKKYGARCRATAYNILQSREDSEECTNDTYMRLWNTIPPQEPSPLAAFIYRIVRNLALDRVKLLHRKRRLGENYTDVYNELSDFIPSPENIERTVEVKELTALIDRFLDTLGRDTFRSSVVVKLILFNVDLTFREGFLKLVRKRKVHAV